MILAAVFLICYIIGSLNSAIIAVALIKHKDIRNYGSKNAGLTNVYRCFGQMAALATIFIDVSKAAVIVYGTKAVLHLPAFEDFKLDALSVCLISVLFGVIGHCYPVFYKFHGGKGILLAAMCMVFTDPMIFLFEAIIFAVLVYATRYISVGSMAACLGYPVFTLLWQTLSNRFLNSDYENIWLHVLIIFPLFILCFFRHFSNIQKLWKGEEKRFGFHKKGENE